MAVEGQEILEEDGAGPAVAQQVMLSEQEAMAVRAQAEKRSADQRRLIQYETSATVLGFDLVSKSVAFAQLYSAEIVFAPGHGAARVHDLERTSAAIQVEIDAKIGMVFEQSVQSATQAIRAEGAVEIENELYQIRILAFAFVVSVEE